MKLDKMTEIRMVQFVNKRYPKAPPQYKKDMVDKLKNGYEDICKLHKKRTQQLQRKSRS